jgi:hypothetical protein
MGQPENFSRIVNLYSHLNFICSRLQSNNYYFYENKKGWKNIANTAMHP